MLVQEILKSKAGSGVVTVSLHASVAEAAKVMSENRFGTVVVSADGEYPDGILSERDIVRELAKAGSSCLDQPVSGYMTRELVTCTSQSNVGKILQQMTDGRFRHMPVVEDGKLIGIITLGDAVKAQLSQVAMEKNALQDMIMGH
ncbi:CBS domain-containing protein [Leisingera methylohalidivorans]|uniref:Inosine-5-monophosphate dehydrogenase n=1 Tax=Leisingera methylohalidivorans DSM 14336 TaxID=999552 RepID=V9VT05_9RHOB|nr:CBS domain-containing protein [Leisingera methylohalidivorans]AHD00814.1 inosine-5-monophosphate dehydrogenase [Leisingera methylohalidivorans DSM 14336]